MTQGVDGFTWGACKVGWINAKGIGRHSFPPVRYDVLTARVFVEPTEPHRLERRIVVMILLLQRLGLGWVVVVVRWWWWALSSLSPMTQGVDGFTWGACKVGWINAKGIGRHSFPPVRYDVLTARVFVEPTEPHRLERRIVVMILLLQRLGLGWVVVVVRWWWWD